METSAHSANGRAPVALSIAKASPDAVKRHDKSGWLSLFTDGVSIEDPVGAGAYVGRDRLSSFWDVFIAPQRDITIVSRKDFVFADRVLRWVRISTLMALSDQPFEVPALLEYRIAGDQISSLRAYWEPRHAVAWHTQQGFRGIMALLKHGARTFTGLGLKSAMGFGLALRPSVSRRRAAEIAESLAASIGRSQAKWRELTDGAVVRVSPRRGGTSFLDDPGSAWELALADAPAMRVEETLIAGDSVACILSSSTEHAAAVVRFSKGRPAEIQIVFA